MPEYRYKAFLSYSQAADGRLCESMQSRLQRFATPWYRRRSIRVFRDTTGLGPTPDLWESIRSALLSSEYLILLASERSAHSPWVGQEVDAFLGARSADRLLIAWTDGELVWDHAAGDFDWSRTTCLPERLRGAFHAEPMYLDVRWARTAGDLSPRRPEFVDAIARLSATLRQLPIDDLLGEDIRHYRATRRVATSAIVALTILLIGAIVGAIVAVQQRNLAREQQRIAEERTEESRQRLVRLTVTNGIRRLDDLDLSASALWFAEAVELESSPADRDLQRLRLRSALAVHPKLRQLWSTGRLPERRAVARQVGFGRGDRYVLTHAFSLEEPTEVLVWDAGTGMRVPLQAPQGERLLAIDTGADRLVIASAAADGDTVYTRDATGTELSAMKHPCTVTGADFSADGTLMWTECDDGVIRVWEPARGALAASLPHGAGITFLLVTPDNKRVLSGTADNTAHVWTLGAGGRAASHVEVPHQDSLQEILVGMDGARVLTLASYEARLWEIGAKGTPELLETWIDVNRMALSPDGERIALATGYGQVLVCDVETGKELFHVQHDDVVFDAVFSADGRRLASASRDRTARVWDAREGQPIAPPLYHESSVSGVGFASQGTRLATIAEDDTVRVWDLATGPRHPHEYVRAAKYFPDGKHVMTVGDFDVKIWDTATWEAVTLAPRSQVYHASISADGQRVATATQDGLVRIWNAAAGSEEKQLLHGRAVRQALFSPDGRSIVSAGQVQGRHEAIVWDLATGEKSATLSHGSSYLTETAFSPDGKRLLTIASDAMRVWDLAQGKEIPALHVADVKRAIWDATGTRLAVSTTGVQVLDASTGMAITPVIHQDAFRVTGVAFATGGTTLAIATEGGFVRIWDGKTGEPVTPPFGHGRGTYARDLEVSADGNFLATSGTDGSARLWDVRTGQVVTPGLRHPDIDQAAFSPDGQHLVTVGDDVREWDLSSQATPGSDDELRQQAQLLAARRIDSTGAVSALTAADVLGAWANRKR